MKAGTLTFVLLISLPFLCFAGDRALPDHVPLPQQRPDSGKASVGTSDARVREPDAPEGNANGSAPAAAPAAREAGPAPSQPEMPPPKKEDPKEYSACIAALKLTGIAFEEVPGFDDGGGCGIDKPLIVREVLPGIRLEPEAKLRCETALQLSRWAKGAVLPAAALALGPGRKLTAFHQASGYVCRNRDSVKAGTLSEHARGNAIDIDRFMFADNTSIGVEPRAHDSTLTGAFQRAIVASGCLYFTTVLGPQSDGFHKTHIHLDVIRRSGGYRYCW